MSLWGRLQLTNHEVTKKLQTRGIYRKKTFKLKSALYTIRKFLSIYKVIFSKITSGCRRYLKAEGSQNIIFCAVIFCILYVCIVFIILKPTTIKSLDALGNSESQRKQISKSDWYITGPLFCKHKNRRCLE